MSSILETFVEYKRLNTLSLSFLNRVADEFGIQKASTKDDLLFNIIVSKLSTEDRDDLISILDEGERAGLAYLPQEIKQEIGAYLPSAEQRRLAMVNTTSYMEDVLRPYINKIDDLALLKGRQKTPGMENIHKMLDYVQTQPPPYQVALHEYIRDRYLHKPYTYSYDILENLIEKGDTSIPIINVYIDSYFNEHLRPHQFRPYKDFISLMLILPNKYHDYPISRYVSTIKQNLNGLIIDQGRVNFLYWVQGQRKRAESVIEELVDYAYVETKLRFDYCNLIHRQNEHLLRPLLRYLLSDAVVITDEKQAACLHSILLDIFENNNLRPTTKELEDILDNELIFQPDPKAYRVIANYPASRTYSFFNAINDRILEG